MERPPGEPTGSASIAAQEYWWYVARERLFRSIFGEMVGQATRSLDVGSADGPSSQWLRTAQHVPLDTDPRGLSRGGVCASALELPFRDATFDLVSAFDVVEHIEDEDQGLAELARVLAPGGHLLLAVPAYEWAWTHHDDDSGHYRRYTRRRLAAAIDRAGLRRVRTTYVFGSTFPLFAAQRLGRRAREEGHRQGSTLDPGEVPRLPRVPPIVARGLIRIASAEAHVVSRINIPFGSSVTAIAVKV